MLPLMPLLYTWVAVTLVMMILIAVRRVLESREKDWLPITHPAAKEIQNQEQIERKVHKLSPVVHVVEVLDVLLLLVVAGVWIYNGINGSTPM